MKKFIIVIIAIVSSMAIMAQGNISFTAYSNAKEVVLNNYFEVTFTLKNGDGSNFISPTFTGFKVSSGPNSSFSTQIINGRVTKERNYSYSLQPTKVGQFTIKSASIKVQGKTYRTSPLTIKVVKGKDNVTKKGTNEASAFVQAEISTDTAFIGQQVTLTYKLYTLLDVANYSETSESDYAGFYAEEVKRYDSRVKREVIEGVQYITKVLKKIALFPQQTGKLIIDPMTLQLNIVVGGSKNRSFFFRRNTRQELATTNAIEVFVNRLPLDAPPTFSGAVGKYNLNANLDKTSLTTDDALTIKMTITGNGDLKRLQPPNLILPKSFEIYDPNVLKEEKYENQGQIIGRKEIEYLVLPKVSGRYTIQPEFSFLDTDRLKYVTLKSRSFPISVREGSNNLAKTKLPEEARSKEDIRFIKTTTKFNQKDKYFFGSPMFWILTILPFLIFGGIFVWKQRQKQKGNIDVEVLKNKRANKIAQKRLAAAKKYMEENKSKAFYDEVSRASLGYVCDKLNIPLAELTKDTVRDKLVSLNVSEHNINVFMEIIKTCEMALFAGMDNSAAMSETYGKAIENIANVEQELAK